MEIQWVERDTLYNTAISYMKPADTILDIGAGIRPQPYIKPGIHIVCEPHSEYVSVLRHQQQNNLPELFIIQDTAQNFVELLPDQSIDTIFLLDVIEHLEKEEGQQLLEICERLVCKQIILFTPIGFLPQDYEAGETDGWGLSGGEWQQHRSGWLPTDFDDSWQIVACKDFHQINGKGDRLDSPFGAMWVIKTISPEKVNLSENLLISVIQHLGVRGRSIQNLEHLVAEQDIQIQRYSELEQQYSLLEIRYNKLEQQYNLLEIRHNALEYQYTLLTQQVTWAIVLQNLRGKIGRKVKKYSSGFSRKIRR